VLVAPFNTCKLGNVTCHFLQNIQTTTMCSVSSSTGLVYVAGGINERSNDLASAEAYNVEEDKWEILPPMIQPHGLGLHSVFIEGKFMVLSEYDRSAEVFDPSAGTWRLEDTLSFEGDLFTCAASSSGELYAFHEEQQQVIKYEGEKNVWTAVASFPTARFLRFVMCATQWRGLFFVGTSHTDFMFEVLEWRFFLTIWFESACSEWLTHHTIT
jgi:hypothetical protein